MEGVITILSGIAGYFLIVDFPELAAKSWAFLTPAESELLSRSIGEVVANYGEIAVFQFQNVRASVERRILRAARVEIVGKASNRHARYSLL